MSNVHKDFSLSSIVYGKCTLNLTCSRGRVYGSCTLISHCCRDHINEAGKQCHGSIREATVENPDWSIRCQVAPRLSTELKKHLLDLLRAGMTVSTIHDLHCTQQMNISGLAPDLNCSILVPLCTLDGRDDLLHKRDLHNLNMKRQRETTRRHDNDLISIQKWIDAYPERVVIHRQYCIGPPEVEFILALQSPWQLAQMVELSHGRALALDSTFAITKYGVGIITFQCLLPTVLSEFQYLTQGISHDICSGVFNSFPSSHWYALIAIRWGYRLHGLSSFGRQQI